MAACGSIMSMVEKIEMQPWYFGFLSRDHIISHLSKPGDWCVRSSGSNKERILFVITKTDELNVRELQLKYNTDEKGWTLVDMKSKEMIADESITYESLSELLSPNSNLSQKINLRCPINRPDYLLNDENLILTDIKLGEGHYGEVVKGTLKMDGQEISVAVKRCLQDDTVISISDKRPTKEIIRAKMMKSHMIEEARLVCGFMHENIIKMYGVACDFTPVKIVMEFCPGGCLRDLLIEKKELIKNVERNIFLFEAAKALRHLQFKKFVHRDVAARNCLIGITGSLKLADFGLSKPVDDLKDLHNIDEDIAWPIPWMAPETLSKKPKFTTKSDVYAFGILIYEVYSCGGKPWPDVKHTEDIIPLVRQGKMMLTPPLMTEKELEEIMHDCWKRKAVERPDFSEIVVRFRAILQAQKLPTGEERIVSMLKGVNPLNTVNLEEISSDSILSKQDKIDNVDTVTKRDETTEETCSTPLFKGKISVSVPVMKTDKCKNDTQTPHNMRFSRHRHKFGIAAVKKKRLASSTSAIRMIGPRKSLDYIRKWTNSMYSRRRSKRAHYKKRKKLPQKKN